MSTLMVFEAENGTFSREARVLRLEVDLIRIEQCGGRVLRFNFREHSQDFSRYPVVLAEMGNERQYLPVILRDGHIVSKGSYPSRKQLAEWAEVEVPEQGGCGGDGCTCGG